MPEQFVTINDGGTVKTVQIDGLGSTNLASLNDVNVVNKVDKSILVYDQASSKFVANDVNTVVTITDGGNF